MLVKQISDSLRIWILDKAHDYIGLERRCRVCNYLFGVGDKIVSLSKRHHTVYYCFECAKLVRLI